MKKVIIGLSIVLGVSLGSFIQVESTDLSSQQSKQGITKEIAGKAAVNRTGKRFAGRALVNKTAPRRFI